MSIIFSCISFRSTPIIVLRQSSLLKVSPLSAIFSYMLLIIWCVSPPRDAGTTLYLILFTVWLKTSVSKSIGSTMFTGLRLSTTRFYTAVCTLSSSIFTSEPKVETKSFVSRAYITSSAISAGCGSSTLYDLRLLRNFVSCPADQFFIDDTNLSLRLGRTVGLTRMASTTFCIVV